MKILYTLTLILSLFCTSACTPSPFSTPISSSTPTPTLTPRPTSTPITTTLDVHFLDVGQADCMLIKSGNKTMLIDGGNTADSSLVYSYLSKEGISTIDYMIATHPDEDHIGGLSAPLSTLQVNAVYAPDVSSDTKAFNTFKSKVSAQSLEIQHPQTNDIINLGESTAVFYVPAVNEEDINSCSLYVKIIHGGNSFLFTGDGTVDAEYSLISQGCNLQADVLKVAHHGSDSSTSSAFLSLVRPKYAVISVGEGNPYGHPTEEVLNRLQSFGAEVYRTDLNGDIIASSNGSVITFSYVKNNTVASKTITEGYIGNKKSKKYHIPTCKSLPLEKNRVFFDSEDEAVNNGYSPCGNCIGR